MEQAFKLHIQTSEGTETAKFLVDKIEVLGKRKTIIEKNLNEFQENDSEVISLDQVRDDLEGRIQQATKGWAKLPAIQKKRALRKFVQKILVSQNGLDIYYFSNAVSEERSLGVLCNENQSVAKVLPFKGRGTRNGDLKLDSKQWVENCPMGGLVTLLRFERRTLTLEG